MSIFSWIPDPGATKNQKFNVTEIRFGDSYSQRQSVGINNSNEEWSLNFNNRSKSEADEIDSFLISMGGVTAFDFTPPNESYTIKVVCRSGNWSKQILKGSYYNLSVKLEQVYEP